MASRTFFFRLLLFMMNFVRQSMSQIDNNSNNTNQRYRISTNKDSLCGSFLCRNGGQCIWMGTNNYRCQCDSNGYWLGSDCSIPNPCISNPCNSHGQCYFWPDATYFCVCYANFLGSNCQFTSSNAINNNICLINRPCWNGGTCIPSSYSYQYACECPPNFNGPDCQWTNSVTMATTSIIPTATLKTTAKPDSTSSNLSGCGVSQSKAPVDYDRIINGQSVYSNTWPWLVSLQTSSGSHFCGGTLIDTLHVITAAHCFDLIGTTPNLFKVVAGVLNIQQTFNSHDVQHLSVDRIFRHERYSNTVLNNDIAVIKLRIPAKITSSVAPICLPSADGKQDPKIGQSVQIAGWGYTNSATKQLASQLQQATIQVLDINDDLSGRPGCSTWIRRGYPITASQQICAMSRDTRTDSCQGDSGGPLIRDVGSRWYLFGIVSYGDTICASSTAAGVYTRVSGYIPWIQQKLHL